MLGLPFFSRAQENRLSGISVTLFRPTQCALGEGAFWDSHRSCLWMVDIENGAFLRLDPNRDSVVSVKASRYLGTLVPAREADRLVLGVETGVVSVNPDGSGLKKEGSLPGLLPHQRLNDGKCDPKGRFWVGGMNLGEKKPEARLFCLETGKQARAMLDSVTISNGICWSRDGLKMYYIDTPTRKVRVFDFDLTTGSLSKGRVLISIPDSLGWPDGMTLDANGDIWIGMWGGYGVGHWSAKDGHYLGKVSVPAPNVTSCAFGGTDFDTLFITTARVGLSEDQIARFPLSGNVFSCKPGKKGFQMPYWKP